MRRLLVWPLVLLGACASPPPPATPTPVAGDPAAGGPEAPDTGETETSPQGPAPASPPEHGSERGSHQHGGHGHAAHHEFHRPTHRFDDANNWSQVFDAPERDAWQRPQAVIEQLGLAPDAQVADIGAGTGYFTVRLARTVPQGLVLAVDIEPNLIAFIDERIAKEGLKNVRTQLAPANDPQLPAGLDLVLVVNTYHHIAERPAYFTKVREALAPEGRLVLVEWRLGQQEHGPPDDHKLPPEVITRELATAGFQLCREWDGLPHQHVLFYGVGCQR